MDEKMNANNEETIIEERHVSVEMAGLPSVHKIENGDHDTPDGIDPAEDEEEILPDVDFESEKDAKKVANTYAAKKTVAQGMMDIALITANANQLRYLVEFNSNSSTFYVNVVLITISLLLQIAVGVSLIFKGRLDLKGMSKEHSAKMINNYVVVGVFLITIINVFVATFTVTKDSTKK